MRLLKLLIITSSTTPKVPGWMRTMRRRPFVGAPFLTYTFKAFPYVMESFARRPQKFIKYMALPYVMAQAFMANQDLDDDDYEEIMRMLPKWQKEKSSIYLLPWKDSNGNFQTIDFGYYLLGHLPKPQLDGC